MWKVGLGFCNIACFYHCSAVVLLVTQLFYLTGYARLTAGMRLLAEERALWVCGILLRLHGLRFGGRREPLGF